MTAFGGRRLRIHLGNDDPRWEVKAAAGAGALHAPGLRSRTATRNRSEVDVTDDDADGWRTLLPAHGVRSMDLSFSGVMRQRAYAQLDHFLDDPVRFAIENPEDNYPKFEVGKGFLQSLESTAEHDGLVEFSATVLMTGVPERMYGTPYTGKQTGIVGRLSLVSGNAPDVTPVANQLNGLEYGSVQAITMVPGTGTGYLVMDGGSEGATLWTFPASTGIATLLTDVGEEDFSGEQTRPTGFVLDDSTHGWVFGEDDQVTRVTLADGSGAQVGAAVNYGQVSTNLIRVDGAAKIANGVVIAGGRKTVSGTRTIEIWTVNTTLGELTDRVTLEGDDDILGLHWDGVNVYTVRDGHLARVDLATGKTHPIVRMADSGAPVSIL